MTTKSLRRTLLNIWWTIDETIFPFVQKLGFHIMKTHYYSPIPATDSLPEALWTVTNEMVGINLRDKQQQELVTHFSQAYRHEYKKIPFSKNDTKNDKQYYVNNGLFESVDAEILYCLIRDRKPKRIIEIGSGYSTLIITQAVTKNRKQKGETTIFESYEPYPQDFLKSSIPGLTKFHTIPAQHIPLDTFELLGNNDMLFIDSSHILKIGSDVQYEYLQVIPRLRKGVLVHIHDIFLPFEYPKDWVIKYHRFSTEQYLLQAFLTFNKAFQVIWGSRYMHHTHPTLLRNAFPSYDPHTSLPESFWIQRII